MQPKSCAFGGRFWGIRRGVLADAGNDVLTRVRSLLFIEGNVYFL
jgi:hypothetical protein